MHFKRVSILGVGLLGGSFARSIRKKEICSHITGHGRTKSTLERAMNLGIIDSYELDPAKACKDADLVVFATPVGRFTSLAGEISGALKKGAVVIDVGSVKGPLVQSMEVLMPEGVHFVGCHPIAGNEQSGLETSSAELFEGALCILTRTDRTDNEILNEITEIWTALGTRVVVMDPEEHDKIYGLVSHLPHIAAYSLVNVVNDVYGKSLNYSGKGFLDTTRIALSPPSLWRDICLMNKHNVLDSIKAFKSNLEWLYERLEAEDGESLERAFSKAKSLREGIGS